MMVATNTRWLLKLADFFFFFFLRPSWVIANLLLAGWTMFALIIGSLIQFSYLQFSFVCLCCDVSGLKFHGLKKFLNLSWWKLLSITTSCHLVDNIKSCTANAISLRTSLFSPSSN